MREQDGGNNGGESKPIPFGNEANRANFNPEFAREIKKNAELPDTGVKLEAGQIYRHRNGFLYKILATKIEMAGQLRHQNPSGYVHVYQCMSSGKVYARLTDFWEREMVSFKRVELTKGNGEQGG